METTAERKNRSRAKRKASGKNIVVTVPDVRETFLPLYRHGRLPTSYLKRFRPGGGTGQRLKNLFHETAGTDGHYLYRISDHWRYINPLYRDELYELGEKGEEELRLAGLIGDYQNPLQQKARMREMTNLPHTVMISTTTASIELGVLQAGTHRFFSWDQVIETMPQGQRAKEVPFAMPVNITHRFHERTEHKAFSLIPDGMFALRDEATRLEVGFTVEAENRKQSGASNLSHTSFLKTFLAYREINRTKAYELLGLSSLMVLAVTRSQRRIDEMKKVVMEVTQGRGSAQFCFHAIPVLGSPEAAPKPDETLFTGGWQRAGHTDFFLNTFSDKEKGRP